MSKHDDSLRAMMTAHDILAEHAERTDEPIEEYLFLTASLTCSYIYGRIAKESQQQAIILYHRIIDLLWDNRDVLTKDRTLQ